jgi:hypothetical protein
MSEPVAIEAEKVEPSGYVITIKEVWTKDHSRGFWIAQDTGGRTVHATTPELAVKRLREMFWDSLKGKLAEKKRRAKEKVHFD